MSECDLETSTMGVLDPQGLSGHEKKNDGTGFSPSISVLSCRYHSSKVPYSFIRHLRCITLATDSFIK